MSSYYAQYWAAYGGIRALFSSKYFILAIFFAWASPAYWLRSGWVSLSLQIFPNLLGFTLGGYALILSMGGEKFLLSLAGGKRERAGFSKFVIFNASYVHFVVFQSITLVAAMLFNGVDGGEWFWRIVVIENMVSRSYYCFDFYEIFGAVLNFSGAVLMFYTVFLVFPTALNVFRLAVNYDSLRRMQKNKVQADRKKLKGCERQGVSKKLREIRKKVRGY
ncbi:hypothetical protein [Chromobacterium haemolyticum]|uniref:hypothetical protein n=1 Tax=Chromobacterium haemolyticum TaxID=394935 RepID=UPI0011B1E811|nr:hypothetical protein [Chromobacterium haemolyticum]